LVPRIGRIRRGQSDPLYFSKAKTVFQSSFMLATVQPFASAASSRPRDRPLRRAHAQDRIYGSKCAEQVRADDEERHNEPAVAAHPTQRGGEPGKTRAEGIE